MGMGQNLVPLVNPKIAGKWMFIPLKMVLIGIDPSPYDLKPQWCSNVSNKFSTFSETWMHLSSSSIASPMDVPLAPCAALET